jgi:hypothetical protein
LTEACRQVFCLLLPLPCSQLSASALCRDSSFRKPSRPLCRTREFLAETATSVDAVNRKFSLKTNRSHENLIQHCRLRLAKNVSGSSPPVLSALVSRYQSKPGCCRDPRVTKTLQMTKIRSVSSSEIPNTFTLFLQQRWPRRAQRRLRFAASLKTVQRTRKRVVARSARFCFQ